MILKSVHCSEENQVWSNVTAVNSAMKSANRCCLHSIWKGLDSFLCLHFRLISNWMGKKSGRWNVTIVVKEKSGWVSNWETTLLWIPFCLGRSNIKKRYSHCYFWLRPVIIWGLKYIWQIQRKIDKQVDRQYVCVRACVRVCMNRNGICVCVRVCACVWNKFICLHVWVCVCV